MNDTEVGMYIKLLCHCWIEDGLPINGSSRVVDLYFKKSPTVAQCFVEKEGKYRNPRLDEERDKQRNWREKCSKGGLHSAEKKKLIKGSSTKTQVRVNSSSSSSSSSSIKKDSRESSIAESPGDKTFEEIYEIWPRKEDKGKAREKYNFLVDVKKIEPECLKNAAIGYLRCEKSKGTEIDFIKYLKTFFYAGNPKKNIPGTWEGYEKYADDKYKQGPPL
jgi:uncharacterized protein YdaU (DUF1376 family)